MSIDDEDDELLRLYRGAANERPGAVLDNQVLKAVRKSGANKHKMPVIFAAAACLLIALFAGLLDHQHAPAGPSPDTRTFGMYEGRAAEILSDPKTMQQMVARQMPGGTN